MTTAAIPVAAEVASTAAPAAAESAGAASSAAPSAAKAARRPPAPRGTGGTRKAPAKKAPAKKAPAKKAPAKKAAPAKKSAAAGGGTKAPAKKSAAPGGGAPPAAKKTSGRGRPQAPGEQRTRGRSRGGQSFAPALKIGGGRHARQVLIAEYVLCVVLIGATPVLMRRPSNGKLYVPNDFVRLSAVSLLFFVLAIASSGQRSARVATAFGALVTLGTVYNAAGSIKAIGNVFATAKTSGGKTRTAAAGTATVDAPHYTPTDLTANPSAPPTSSATTPGVGPA